MNKKIWLTFSISAILGSILSVLGFPLATSYSSMHCVFCLYVSTLTFVLHGVLDFVIWFIMGMVLSNLALEHVIHKLVYHPK